MADPTTTPDPASIAAGIAAAGSLLHRVLDVGSVRKRLKAVEALGTALRADLDALTERVKNRRTDTGSQPRVTMQPPPPSADVERRLAESERRLTVLERESDERAKSEREIAVALGRIEGRLDHRASRARERGSDG